MTTVIAYRKDNKIIMCGDFCGSNEDSQGEYSQDKCFKSGDFWFGFAGSFAVGQALMHSDELSKIKINKKLSLEKEIFNKIIPVYKNIVNDVKQTSNFEGEERFVSTELILCYDNKRIFVINGDDFSFLEYKNLPFSVIGMGENIMKGAFDFVGKEIFEKDLQLSLTKVMLSISRHCIGVSGTIIKFYNK